MEDRHEAIRKLSLGGNTPVVDTNDQTLGAVEELLVAPRSGQVVFVSVRLERGDKRHALLPWSAFAPAVIEGLGPALRLDARRDVVERLSR